MASSGKRLRELIQAPEILVLPGAWDGLSAILIEQAGFQGVYVSCLVISYLNAEEKASYT